MCGHKLISEKELKYFTYNFKKATNLGKLFFLPKIHKRYSGRYGTLSLNISWGWLRSTWKKTQWKGFTQGTYWGHSTNGRFVLKSNIFESNGEVKRQKCGTASVMGLYPWISHGAGLEALGKRLNERDSPKVPTEDIVRMADLFSKVTFLNPTARSNDKSVEQLLAQNLYLLMLASSWMK